jgi:hypothetical protein
VRAVQLGGVCSGGMTDAMTGVAGAPISRVASSKGFPGRMHRMVWEWWHPPLPQWQSYQAVGFSAFRDARWHDHPEFGRRLLVRGLTDERVPIVAILKPINEQEGIWECKTARRDL